VTIGRIKKPIGVIMTSLVLIFGTFALAIQYQEAEAAGPAFKCNIIISSGVLVANVVVPAGETCDISMFTIQGNVRVAKDAVFICSGGSIIEGNLQARGAERVDLGDCTIDGNVSILNSNTVTMESTSIGGKLTLRGNNSISLEDVTVTGLATCARNTNQDASDPNMYDGGNNGCPQPVD